MTTVSSGPAARVREFGAVAAAYALFAVVFTWPTAARLGEVGLLAGSAPFDALIFRWNFHWLAESLAAGSSPLWTDQLFFPERVPLMLHTNTLFYAFLSLPVQWLFEGGRGLHIAFHLCVLGSFTAAGLATFALARRLCLSPAGAFLAGVAFAFCGARVTNLARLHVLCSELVPLALLALHWTMAERRLRGPLALTACMTLLAYNSATLLTITATGLALLLPALWREASSGCSARLLGAAAASVLLASPLLPGVVEGLGWPGLSDTAEAERVIMSLDLSALFWPNADDLLLGAILPARPAGFLEEQFSFFVGIPVAVLVLAAVVSGERVARSGRWLTVAGVGWVLALGPEAKWLEEPLGILLPYDFLEQWLLPLRVSRVPARFLVLTSLVLALVAGAGLDALAKRLGLGSRAVIALAALLSAVVALDGTERLPLRTLEEVEPDPHPMARALAALPARSAVLDLPYDGYYAGRFAMFYQTEHRRPVLFGAYPRAPRSNRAHFEDISLFALLSDPEVDAETLAARLEALDLPAERERLRARGIGAIVLHHELWKLGAPPVRAEMAARWRAIVASLAAAWGAPERVSAGYYGADVFRL